MRILLKGRDLRKGEKRKQSKVGRKKKKKEKAKDGEKGAALLIYESAYFCSFSILCVFASCDRQNPPTAVTAKFLAFLQVIYLCTLQFKIAVLQGRADD